MLGATYVHIKMFCILLKLMHCGMYKLIPVPFTTTIKCMLVVFSHYVEFVIISQISPIYRI